jgi:pimeloyl-ACP methyl ester carboxylesterase
LGTIGERQFLNDFADALCLDKFFMGGQGTGMELIVQYVMVHPDRVSGMLLIDGRLWGLVDIAKRVVTKDGKWASDPDRRTVPFDGTAKSIENNMLGMTVNPNTVWPALVDMRLKSAALQEESFALRQPANERIANDPNLQQLVSIKGRFDKLTIPAIYLFGLQDNNNPVENGFLQEDLGLENIQFFYLDECGHQAQNDQPEKFGQISLEFFRDGKVSWKTAEWVGASRRTPINSNLVEEPSGGFPSSVPDFYNQFTREAKAAVKA